MKRPKTNMSMDCARNVRAKLPLTWSFVQKARRHWSQYNGCQSDGTQLGRKAVRIETCERPFSNSQVAAARRGACLANTGWMAVFFSFWHGTGGLGHDSHELCGLGRLAVELRLKTVVRTDAVYTTVNVLRPGLQIDSWTIRRT